MSDRRDYDLDCDDWQPGAEPFITSALNWVKKGKPRLAQACLGMALKALERDHGPLPVPFTSEDLNRERYGDGD